MSNDRDATSITHKLQRLADRLGVETQLLRVEYLLERLAARISSDKDLAEKVVFKGGVVSSRVYMTERFTRDLDISMHERESSSLSRNLKDAVENNLNDGCWYKLRDSHPLKLQTPEGGERFSFYSGLGKVPEKIDRCAVVDLDVSANWTAHRHWVTTPSLLGEADLNWQVCLRELTVAEKLHALISRGQGNTRSKDVYDLAKMLPECSRDRLKDAIEQTFQVAGTPIPADVRSAFGNVQTDLLAAGWRRTVQSLRTDMTFDDAWKIVTEQSQSLWRDLAPPKPELPSETRVRRRR